MNRFALAFLLLASPALASDAGLPDAGSTDAGAPDAIPGDAGAASVVDSPKVTKIRAALDAIGGFEQVTISEQAGVIRLDGSVGAPAGRRVAEEVTKRVADPIYVANGIEVIAPEDNGDGKKPDPGLAADEQDAALEGKLRSILSTVPALSGVKASVETGIVHLTGETNDKDALQHALDLSRKMDGALFVDNQVQVITTIKGQLADTWETLKQKSKALVGNLPVVGVGLLILFLAVLLARLVRNSQFIGKLFSSHQLLQTVALRVLATVIVVGGIILALEVMDATGIVGALLGTAGIVGLAIGFAFKDIVENYLAGVLLAISRPFAAKDDVKIGEYQGKVVRLSARETMLMTYDGNHVQIPNAQVFGNAVLNYTRNPRRRFDFVVGVGNEEDLGRAQRVANEAMTAMEGVMDDPAPYTRLDGFGDSSMTLHFYGWVDTDNHAFGKVKSEVIRTVKRVLDENEIDLPNPITQILLETVEPKPKKKANESAAPAHDLSVDNEIEEQIDDDPSNQTETDLLDG